MLSKIGLILVVVGALNWGLVGLLNFDLVAFLFGAGSLLTRAVSYAYWDILLCCAELEIAEADVDFQTSAL